MTPEDVQHELLSFRVEFHKEFGQLKAELYKTLWLTQLTTIGIVLVGAASLLLHFHI
jgi:hypothetical protein